MEFAASEIRRSPVRFGLLTGAVGLLVFLIVFQQALFNGLITSFIGAIENQNAPILVLSDQARRNVEASILFPGIDAEVGAVDGVAEARPIEQATVTVDAGGTPTDVALFGYSLGGLGEPTTLSAGRLPEAAGEAVASADDAEEGFAVGDTVSVSNADAPDGGATTALRIVGLADNIRWSVQPGLFVGSDTFAAVREVTDPGAPVLAAMIAVRPEPGVEPDVLAARLTDSVDGVEALTRRQAVDENPGVQSVNASFQVILGLAFVVVGLVIGFFFLILTVQKSASMTLLRALGCPTRYLLVNLLAQIAVVVVGGIIVGLGLTLAVGPAASGAVGLDLDARRIALTLLALVLVAGIGAVAPMRRVARIDPIAATGESRGGLS